MANQQGPVVGIVGLGLIGGSLALALRAAGFARCVLAWDHEPAVLRQGLELGVVDETEHELTALMERVDVAVLCTPTVASEPLLQQMLLHPGTARCITDVASVKGPLCRVAAALTPEQARRYVPGHPIAGSERSGVIAAREDLFVGHRVILTPQESTDREATETVRELWQAAGAHVQTMSAKEHDAVLAATSHLPHVLAYALVDALAQSPTRDDVFRFAAGGFRDFTRIASSDPVMWRDIALANRDALLASMDDFQRRFEVLREAICQGDGPALEQTFRVAKKVRDEFARDLEERSKKSRTAS